MKKLLIHTWTALNLIALPCQALVLAPEPGEDEAILQLLNQSLSKIGVAPVLPPIGGKQVHLGLCADSKGTKQAMALVAKQGINGPEFKTEAVSPPVSTPPNEDQMVAALGSLTDLLSFTSPWGGYWSTNSGKPAKVLPYYKFLYNPTVGYAAEHGVKHSYYLVQGEVKLDDKVKSMWIAGYGKAPGQFEQYCLFFPKPFLILNTSFQK